MRGAKYALVLSMLAGLPAGALSLGPSPARALSAKTTHGGHCHLEHVANSRFRRTDTVPEEGTKRIRYGVRALRCSVTVRSATGKGRLRDTRNGQVVDTFAEQGRPPLFATGHFRITSMENDASSPSAFDVYRARLKLSLVLGRHRAWKPPRSDDCQRRTTNHRHDTLACKFRSQSL